jgi:hypothetical protein
MTEQTLQSLIIKYRFGTKPQPTFREIAEKISTITEGKTTVTYQYAQQLCARYIKKHPELAPPPKPAKAPKKPVGRKGLNISDPEHYVEADLLIDGYAATAREVFSKCGKAICKKCMGGGPGHGPYLYVYIFGQTPIYVGPVGKYNLSKLKQKSFKDRAEFLKCVKDTAKS